MKQKSYISRRKFLSLTGTASIILSGLPGPKNLLARVSRNLPNVILILTDDQGYGDTGVHGNTEINTPNIDKLGREGIDLTRFYVEPVCAPTRASLLTGRYYYRTGVIHTSRGGAKMAGDEITIAEALKKAGYKTGIFGKWHLGDNYPMRPQDQGFDEVLVHRGGGIGQTPDQPNKYFDPKLWKNGEECFGKGYCTDIFFSEAMNFIERNQKNPFFIYLPTNTPHFPIEISDEYVTPYLEKGINERDAAIYGMIKNIDENIGNLLQKLDTLKIIENTLIIFISDNGPNSSRFNSKLKNRKSSVYEGGIRAISFFYWKGRLLAGKKLDQIAAHIDIFPTLLEICKAEKPQGLKLDGQSLVPLLENRFNRNNSGSRMLFLQCHRGLTPKKLQNCAVVSQRYKMIGYPGSFANESLITNSKNPELELYDLLNDMSEQKDIADQHPEIIKRMMKDYLNWFSEVKSTRNFQPGMIHLGTDRENPTTLCRYQDSIYIDGIPHGWEVVIESSGKYQMRINRGIFTGPGRLVVKWQENEQYCELKENVNSGIFELTRGSGKIEIWFELAQTGRITFSDNSTIGDVTVHRL